MIFFSELTLLSIPFRAAVYKYRFIHKWGQRLWLQILFISFCMKLLRNSIDYYFHFFPEVKSIIDNSWKKKFHLYWQVKLTLMLCFGAQYFRLGNVLMFAVLRLSDVVLWRNVFYGIAVYCHWNCQVWRIWNRSFCALSLHFHSNSELFSSALEFLHIQMSS